MWHFDYTTLPPEKNDWLRLDNHQDIACHILEMNKNSEKCKWLTIIGKYMKLWQGP